MKKVIGIIAAFIIILPVICISALAKPYADYPWVYEDFESGEQINATASNASISPASGGVANTRGSARITVNKNYGTAKFPFKIKNGTTYKMSVWVKMVGDIPQNKNLHFIFYMHQKLADGSPAETASCFKDISVSNVEYSNDNWVYVTTTFTYEGKGRLNGVDVDTCDGDATVELRLGDGTLATTNNNVIDYLIDDLIVEPVTIEQEEEVPDSSVGFVNGNFESGYDESVWTKQNCSVSLISGANNTKNGVMITSISDYGQIKQRIPMEYNKTYRISFYAKAGNDATVGKDIKLIIDRKDGKTDSSITTNYETLPNVALEKNPQSFILTDEWQKYEMIYRSNAVTFEQNKPYIYPRVGTGKELECYCIDELEFEEIDGIVYNGDFSKGLSGWSESGTAVDLSSDVPDSQFTNSVLINETSNYGSFSQGINVQPGHEYVIGFWAKGVNADGIEMCPVLDRYADNSEDSEFYEYLTLKNGEKAKLTNEWQYYEYKYECNSDSDNYRVPLFYIMTADGKNKTSYYLAGVSITEQTEEPSDPSDDQPLIYGLAVEGKTVENHDLTFSYGVGTTYPDGLVKIMKSFEGQYVSVGSAYLDGMPVKYTLTDSDVGSEMKFTAMMIPEDGEPFVKSVITEQVTYALNIEQLFKTDMNSENIKAAVVVNNNDRDREIVAVLALFDSNNAMIGMSEKSLSSEFESIETIDLSIPNDGEASVARLFVWEGKSAAETTMNSLIGNKSITK